MTPTNYMAIFDITKTVTFFGNMVSPTWLAIRLSERVHLSKKLDAAKKALFYGREYNDPVMRNDLSQEFKQDPEFIHAVLGIDSEAAEIVELLLGGKTGHELRTKIVDEGGDLLWYLALLFKQHDISFEEVMDKNIAKLEARYPEGFNVKAAIHRNEAKELAVF